MGQQLLTLDAEERAVRQRQLLRSLEHVDWAKGPHWVGITGNHTASGVFSVKGTKEVAYAVYNALTDSENGGYHQIRLRDPRTDAGHLSHL